MFHTDVQASVDRSKRLLEEIQNLFSRLSHSFAMSKSLRLTNDNIAIERTMKVILNAVYGWNLTPQNHGSKDQAGYDHLDIEKGVAVQITTDRSHRKIQDSLSMIETQLEMNLVKTFYVCYPKERVGKRNSNHQKPFKTSLAFDPRQHVIDLNSLLEEIRDRDVDALQEFLDLVGEQLCDPDLESTGSKVRRRIRDHLARMAAEFETIPTAGKSKIILHAVDAFEPEFHEIEISSVNGEEKHIILGIPDLLRPDGNFVVSGLAGSGKTVALRLLVKGLLQQSTLGEFAESAQSLPIHISDFPTHLDFETIVSSTLNTCLGSNIDLTIHEICKYADINLICDSIDEAANQSKLEESIISFTKRFPQIRVFLATRRCSSRIQSNFRKVELYPLTNFRMHRYLNFVLGMERTTAILAILELHGSLDNFRNPLMCWFLQGSENINNTRKAFRVSTFYQNAIENFLHQMRSKGGSLNLSSVKIDELMIFLGAIGFAMVSARSRSLSGQAADRIWRFTSRKRRHRMRTEDLPMYLELAVLSGILNSSSTGITFSHETIRQFFAAFHLYSMPAYLRPPTLFWSEKWHQVAVFLVSRMDESDAIPILRRLTRSVRWSATIGGFHVTVGTSRLFLTLKLLAQFGDATKDLRKSAVTQLRNVSPGRIYLNRGQGEFLGERNGNYQSVYEEFFSHIGALGHEVAKDLLDSLREYYHEKVLKGYFRFEDPHRTEVLLHALLAPESNDRNRIDCYRIAEYLVRNASSQSISTMKRILQEYGDSERVLLLEAISLGFLAVRDINDHEEKVAINQLFSDALLSTLIDLILVCPDDNVREQSLRVCRRIGEEYLPIEVAIACHGEITKPIPNYNAIWPLIYSRERESQTIIADMIERCSLIEPACAVLGLSILHRRNEELFKSSLQYFLGSYSKDFIRLLDKHSTDFKESLELPESMELANLLYGVVFPLGSVRFMAWWAIFYLQEKEVVDNLQEFAIRQFFEEDSEEVRRILLSHIVEFNRPETEEIVRMGLSDKSDGVIRISLDYYWNHPEVQIDTDSKNLIAELSESDSGSWNVPYNAGKILSRIGHSDSAKNIQH